MNSPKAQLPITRENLPERIEIHNAIAHEVTRLRATIEAQVNALHKVQMANYGQCFCGQQSTSDRCTAIRCDR